MFTEEFALHVLLYSQRWMYACLNLIETERVDKRGAWQNPQDSIKKMRQNNAAKEMQIFQSPLVLLIEK